MRAVDIIDVGAYFCAGTRTPMIQTRITFFVDGLVLVGIDAQSTHDTYTGGTLVSGLGGWSVDYTLMTARPYTLLNIGELIAAEIPTRRRWNAVDVLHSNIRALNIMATLNKSDGSTTSPATIMCRVTGGMWSPYSDKFTVPSTWWRWYVPSGHSISNNPESLAFVAYDDYRVALGGHVGVLSQVLSTDPMGLNISGLWRGTAYQYAPAPAKTGLEWYSVNDCDIIARVPDCDNMVNLLWWSPIIGGWKSAGWEVVGTGMQDITASQYWREDIRAEKKEGQCVLYARLPMCTYRDYQYYSDILLSDEVYRVEYTPTSVYGWGDTTRQRVLVRGQAESRRVDSVADFNISILTEEVATW